MSKIAKKVDSIAFIYCCIASNFFCLSRKVAFENPMLMFISSLTFHWLAWYLGLTDSSIFWIINNFSRFSIFNNNDIDPILTLLMTLLTSFIFTNKHTVIIFNALNNNQPSIRASFYHEVPFSEFNLILPIFFYPSYCHSYWC